ncbi:MAG: phosphodiester glycosidase family protein [Anaerolineales bacterium]|nr:phosphodiester glycosidase family protein [Anaerolineales bacterium]
MKKIKKLLIPCCSIIALGLVALAIISGIWYVQRARPQPTQKMLYEGVEYIRDIRSSPRRMVIHVIKIDLRADGIRLLVTPGNPEEELPLKARTTSQFLNNFDLQIAINGDGFEPWHSRTIFDYYPHVGDRVAPIGFAASEEITYSQDTDKEPTLYLAINNGARFNAPTSKIYNAISGNLMLLNKGEPIAGLEGSPEPRTAVALDRANRYLIFVVVDGRQPGYSEGATLLELAEIIAFHGGWTAMNLDGGGSSTMVVEGALGADVLNSPINNSIPGRERPVGNHLGVYARPLK